MRFPFLLIRSYSFIKGYPIPTYLAPYISTSRNNVIIKKKNGVHGFERNIRRKCVTSAFKMQPCGHIPFV